MDEITDAPTSDLTGLTSEIISAYVSHNAVPQAELARLIATVHASLTGLGNAPALTEPDTKASPAEIRRSIKPDGLTSFVDGRSYTTLKRHLARHALDPASYRTKFGLPADYPMVAASYAAQRSQLARALGLGQVRRTAANSAGTAAVTAEPVPRKRAGRPRKAKAD